MEHNDWMSCDKAACLITALNDPAAYIIYSVPTGANYEEVTAVPENSYGDYHLKAAFHNLLTQCIEEYLQDFVPS
jgi:hypothetical protein